MIPAERGRDNAELYAGRRVEIRIVPPRNGGYIDRQTQGGRVEHKRSQESPLLYVLGGVGIGVMLGVLFAPKKGSELREDIAAWGRGGRERSRTLLARLRAMVPFKVKAAAALGAARAGGAEALREAKDRFNHDGAHDA